MLDMLQWLFYAGPLALLAGIVAMVVYYMKYRMAPEPKRQSPVALYILGCLGVGFAALALGIALGIAVACMGLDAGNLCGLFGVFGTGPLLAGLSIFAFAHCWARNARLPP